MIDKDINELANAMEADPVRWAKNYIELQEMVEELESRMRAILGIKDTPPH